MPLYNPIVYPSSSGNYILGSGTSGTNTLTAPAGVNLGIAPPSGQNVFSSGTWQQGGPFEITDRFTLSISSFSTTTTFAFNTGLHALFTGSSASTFTLNAATVAGGGVSPIQYIKNAGTAILTITRAGSDTINGQTNFFLLPGQSCVLVSDGVSVWHVDSFFDGSKVKNRTTVSDAAYTILATDYLISYITLTAGRAVTLPAPSTTNQGKEFLIKDEVGTAGTSNLTVTPASGTIDGAANKVINTNFGILRVYCNATNYFTW